MLYLTLRAAKLPAAAWAKGDSQGAETAYRAALLRANSYPKDNYRRGMMLAELSRYVMYQGRRNEALDLITESSRILSIYQREEPMSYFLALISSAYFFLHVKKFDEAQRIFEKILDGIPTLKMREPVRTESIPFGSLDLERSLHLELAGLFIYAGELDEAKHCLQAAESLIGKPSFQRRNEPFLALKCFLHIALGQHAEAANVLESAHKRFSEGLLPARVAVQLTGGQYKEAEQTLLRFFESMRKVGTLHRPGLEGWKLDLAESLFGQAKHDDAFASLQEARSIVADFALPADAAWRKTLEKWLQRTRELGRAEVAASLEAELQAMPAMANQAITILERFRLHPQAAS